MNTDIITELAMKSWDDYSYASNPKTADIALNYIDPDTGFGKKPGRLIKDHPGEYTLLQRACYDHNKELAKIVLETGADTNLGYVDEDNDYRPLMIICFKDDPGDPEFVKLLLDHGARITDDIMASACSQGNPEVIKLLVEHGGNVGGPCLMYYMQGDHRDYSLCDYLLEHGADINYIDGCGRSILTRLIDHCYNTYPWLLKHGVDINSVDRNHNTALITACYPHNLYVDIVKDLLERGADPKIVNRRGYTALDVAKNSGHTEIIKLLEAAMA